eukprot:TRINITY_DN8928_c0_g1_i1.p1 TRINITY_DN8928_c0_g1~~TRINITY_DN8928_c0_g1_i1.p1  ORF type:complete len:126 (-),score=52.89 TRINITY_DN8928_c0_g1_i1:84-461(-)
MPGTLFRENSSQRFRRESLEMWEKVKTDDTPNTTKTRRASVKIKGTEETMDSLEEFINEVTEEMQEESEDKNLIEEGKHAIKAADEEENKEVIFPRKVKSKFVATKPALWEQNVQNLKNKNLKKK